MSKQTITLVSPDGGIVQIDDQDRVEHFERKGYKVQDAPEPKPQTKTAKPKSKED
tara:strand:+ start:2923 stop:3087 length:165 start_codon:yes stop_codon:yes gene_type:complete